MVVPFRRFYIPAVKVGVFVLGFENLDGQGLRVQWEVVRDNTSTPDEGVVRIFNMRPTLASAMYESWVRRAELLVFKTDLDIGWDGVAQRVMSGDTWDFIPDHRTPTDVLTIVKFGDGSRTIRDQVVGRTFNGTRLDTALQYLIELPPAPLDAGGGGLGLSYPPESRALIVTAANETQVTKVKNLVQGRGTRETIDDLMATIGLEWRVHNGAFIAMRAGVINRPGPILRPGNGLISYERRNDGGVIFEGLALPDVEPGIQLQVQDNTGKPFGETLYRVEKVTFRGDTAGESLMFGEAAKAVLL